MVQGLPNHTHIAAQPFKIVHAAYVAIFTTVFVACSRLSLIFIQLQLYASRSIASKWKMFVLESSVLGNDFCSASHSLCKL